MVSAFASPRAPEAAYVFSAVILGPTCGPRGTEVPPGVDAPGVISSAVATAPSQGRNLVVDNTKNDNGEIPRLALLRRAGFARSE